MAPSNQTKRRGGSRLAYWLALALVIHAEMLLVFGLGAYFWAPRTGELLALGGGKGAGESIEISAVDDETARKILADLEREEEKAKEEQAKKEIEAPESPGQVVELARPREEKRPEKAQFAAEHDSTVEKETKKHGKFDQKARQGDVQGDAQVSRPASPASQPSPTQEGAASGALAMRTPGPKSRQAEPGKTPNTGPPSTAPVGETLDPATEEGGELGRFGQEAPPRAPAGASGGGAPMLPGAPALIPSEQQLARAIGSGTQDHLKDIDDGDETSLNAKKWKFASFFNRVKQQVREHWRPVQEYRRRDPTGAIYGQKDRYTLLRVQLKPDGSLANVALELPSGIEFLDDVAIEAFRQAQPFPNPPKQLVEGSGLINFRFGFFFELSGAPKMKIFRYNSM